MAHQVILCHIAYIYTADGNAAGRNIPKAGNQIGNRTLAAAGGADDCCDLSLLCYEGNIFKRLLGGIPGIRKTDILENDIIVCRFWGDPSPAFREYSEFRPFVPHSRQSA